jgi:hypothetical protein
MTISLLQHLRTSSGTHHASYSKGTWTLSQALSHWGCEAGQSSLLSAEVKEEWSYKLQSPYMTAWRAEGQLHLFTQTNNIVFHRMSVYRCPKHNSFRGITRRMKTLYSINITYSRTGKDIVCGHRSVTDECHCSASAWNFTL